MSTVIENNPVVFGLQQDVRSLPETIELFRAGSWHTPNHGDFQITIDDIDEAITHFNSGVHRVQKTEPLAGTLDHLGGGTPAVFRIHGLYRVEDSLMAAVTWTELGKEKLARDEYRYVSFEFNHSGVPYVNPEDASDIKVNVLSAATLTNDPLFKNLKPVLASAKSGVANKSKGDSMNLEELRAKELADLTTEEKAFLAEHKAELTEDELKKFELVEAETEEAKAAREAKELADKEAADKAAADEAAAKAAAEKEEADKLEASAKLKGKVTIDAKELEQLRASAKRADEAHAELLKSKLTASVRTHVDRGAIKGDQLKSTVEMLMASSESQRATMETFLESLPDNKLLASAQGSGGEGDEKVELTPEEESMAKAFNNDPEKVKEFKAARAAEEEGK